MALIWFSCFCCASENFRLTPASLEESWIDFVFAVRQPDSAPTCATPSVILSLPPPDPPVEAPEPVESESLPPHAGTAIASAATDTAAATRFMEHTLSPPHWPSRFTAG